MKTNFLYEFHIKGWKEPSFGIVIDFSEEWILVKRIINDYLYDGFSLIRRKYVKKVVRDENVIFIEKVLKAKGYFSNSEIYNIPLNTLESPLQWLLDTKKVFMINPKKESIGYVGYIIEISNNSFDIKIMDIQGGWIEKNFLLRMFNVRTIDFDTDYINSLLIYQEKMNK